MKKFVLLICFSLCSQLASAGVGSGFVNHIYAHASGSDDGDGVILFDVDNHTNMPSCSSHEWAFSADTDKGKAMYSLLLVAAATGKSVTISGEGDCNAWGDRERPEWVRINY